MGLKLKKLKDKDSEEDSMQKMLTIGIAGASASGKTLFIKTIMKYLNEKNVSHFDMDGYHYHSREEREKLNEFPDELKANNFVKLSDDLKKFISGYEIKMPIYNHVEGCFSEPILLKPKPILLVEGLHAGLINEISNMPLIDYNIFLCPDDDTRRAWKVKRDVEERFYSYKSAIKQINDREPYVNKYILPQSDKSEFQLITKRTQEKKYNFHILTSEKFIQFEIGKRPTEFKKKFFFDYQKYMKREKVLYRVETNENLNILVNEGINRDILIPDIRFINTYSECSFEHKSAVFALIICYLIFLKKAEVKKWKYS